MERHEEHFDAKLKDKSDIAKEELKE